MPDVRDIPEDIESIASTAGDDHQIEMILAGFRACAKEAIRFLLEEEGLSPDHELPVGLQEHLDRQQDHLAGMLQNDSGLGASGIDEASYYSSADDDESFVTAEATDIDCDDQLDDMVENTISNASDNSISINSTDYHVNQILQNDSSH